MTTLGPLAGVIAVSLWTFARGVYMRWYSRPGGVLLHAHPFWGDTIDWPQALAQWGMPAPKDQAEQLASDVQRCWYTAQSAGLLAASTVALALSVGVLAGVSVLPVAYSAAPWASVWVVLAGWVLAYRIGVMWGVERLRARATARRAYADLRRRRLASYRTSLGALLAFGCVAVCAAATAALVSHVPAPGNLRDSSGLVATLPGASWLIWSIPTGMFVFVLALEVELHRIAALPRLLVTESLDVSRRADDMLRARVIGVLMAQGYWLLALAGAGQFDLLRNSVRGAGGPWLALMLVTLAVLVAAAGAVASAHGRLGGVLTRWPWQTSHEVLE